MITCIAWEKDEPEIHKIPHCYLVSLLDYHLTHNQTEEGNEKEKKLTNWLDYSRLLLSLVVQCCQDKTRVFVILQASATGC
jgi:hypothetical protein